MTTVERRTWDPHQHLVDAAYERRRKRAFWFTVIRSSLLGGFAGHLAADGAWLWAVTVLTVLTVSMLYPMTRFAIHRGFYTDRRRAARKAGVCRLCLAPGSRHWTLAGCSRDAEAVSGE